jgi:hypothetical protein
MMSLEIQLSESVLRSYVGEYELGPGCVLAITLGGRQLFAQLDSQPRVKIFAESPIQFFCPAGNARLQFVRDRSRLVTGLILQPKRGFGRLGRKRT